MMATEMMQRNDWLADPFFDDLGRRFFGALMPTPSTHTLKTDIQETDAAYIVTAEVPGRTKQELWLNYQDNVLTLGVKQQTPTTKGTALLKERDLASTSRGFRLPNVAANDISASLDAGLLTVTLPKLTGTTSGDHHIAID